MGRRFNYASSQCQTLADHAEVAAQIAACQSGDTNCHPDAHDNMLLGTLETGSRLCTSVLLEAAHVSSALLYKLSSNFHI